MEPKKFPDDRVVDKSRLSKTSRGSDLWTVVLLAASALALIVLALALMGRLLGR